MPVGPEAAVYQLIKSCRPLDICHTSALNLLSGIVKSFPGHQQPIKFPLQLGRVVFNAPKEINQIPIDIVVDLQIRLTIFCEQYPPGATKYLYVPVIAASLWELLHDFVTQQLLAANPTYKAVHLYVTPKIVFGYYFRLSIKETPKRLKT